MNIENIRKLSAQVGAIALTLAVTTACGPVDGPSYFTASADCLGSTPIIRNISLACPTGSNGTTLFGGPPDDECGYVLTPVGSNGESAHFRVSPSRINVPVSLTPTEVEVTITRTRESDFVVTNTLTQTHTNCWNQPNCRSYTVPEFSAILISNRICR